MGMGIGNGRSQVLSIMQDLYEMSRQEGREEGKRNGFADGFKHGFIDGRKVWRKEGRIDVVVNMIKLEQPIEFIAKVSDMSVEEVTEIAKERGLM